MGAGIKRAVLASLLGEPGVGSVWKGDALWVRRMPGGFAARVQTIELSDHGRAGRPWTEVDSLITNDASVVARGT
jgi:hypothetical protein